MGGLNRAPRLLIRADAGPRIGAGHMMRCLALAQEWKRLGFYAAFMGHCELDAVRLRIADAGLEFFPIRDPHPHPMDLTETLARIRGTKTPLRVVLDGYHFDSGYQEAVRAACPDLLVIDDYSHLAAYHARFLLNQNPGADGLRYSCDPDTELLLGTPHVLLRPEFLTADRTRPAAPELARRILLTLGGSDPDGLTPRVAKVLNGLRIDGLELRVAGGRDLATLMRWADVAVTAAGTTSLETAFLGLPTVLIVLAENQRGIAHGLASAGAAIDAGSCQDLRDETLAASLLSLCRDPDRRRRMSAAGQALIDGLGVRRVTKRLLS